MKLKEVLSNENCNGEVYASDVVRWVGNKPDYNELYELVDKLTELKNEDK